MSRLPLGIYYWALTRFDDTVTGSEPRLPGCLYEVQMGPIISVMVDVVRDLAKQKALGCKYTNCFLGKRWVRVRKCVAILLRRPQHETEAGIEVLLIVLALVGNVRGIVHNDIEHPITKRHSRIVRYDLRLVPKLDIQPSDGPLAAPPKAPPVDRGV